MIINNDQLILSNIILSAISMITSFITIIVYLKNPKLHASITGMAFGMSISEIINSLGHFLSYQFYGSLNPSDNKYENFICGFQRFCIIYSDLATTLLLLLLCYSIYDLIINNTKKLDNKIRKLLIIGLVPPIIVTALLVSFSYRGENQTITNEESKIIITRYQCYLERSFTITIIMYIILFGLNAVIVYLIIKVIKFINVHSDGGINRAGTKNKLFNFSVLGLLTLIFNLLENVYHSIFKNIIGDYRNEIIVRFYFILSKMRGTFLSLRGIIVFVIFITNKRVLTRIQEFFGQICINLNNSKILQVPKNKDGENDISMNSININDIHDDDEEEEKIVTNDDDD